MGTFGKDRGDIIGLDMYMYRHFKKTTPEAKMLAKIEGEDNEFEEVVYWRKNYVIHNWFFENFSVNNCEYLNVTKEAISALIVYLEENEYKEEDIKQKDILLLKLILETTDFETQELLYYAWW